MYYTGFADEAAGSIEKQIEVTKELGWEHIESRNIEGTNITDISEDKFEKVVKKLNEAEIKINCFGSAVANWGKDPRDEESFKKSKKELERAVPRMKKLGTKMIRGMSYGIPKELGPYNPELEAKIIDNLKEMVNVCEDAGIIYMHENCMNYYSQSYEYMDKLITEIDSPNFKIVFDTANPLMADNRIGKSPYEKQTSWEAYQHLKEKIAYVHIKDGIFVRDTNEIFPEMNFTFPGEGNGDVKRILKDLFLSGYDGGISIEPHMGAVYHDSDNQDEADARYQTYLSYGKKLMKLIEEINTEIGEDR